MEIYDYAIDLKADTSHTRCISLTGHGKRVLEFGCATGYVSKVLTEQFGCTVTGVELNADAAARAAPYCRRVLVGDAEALDYAEELDGERFDVVLFQDVLEHLKAPAALLRKTRDYVAPGGYVVASIPNIAHAAVALELMSGRFAYRPLGLLDDTHLRFFSRLSICELFESTGYVIAELSRIEIAPPSTEFQTNLGSFPPEVVQFALAQDEATTYQFIIKAYPVETGVLAAPHTELTAAQRADAERPTDLTIPRRDLEAAKGEAAAKDGDVARLRRQLETALEQLARRENDVARLSRDLETATATSAAEHSAAAALREELESTQAVTAAAKEGTAAARKQLQSAQAAAATARTHLTRVRAELYGIRQEVAALRHSLADEQQLTQSLAAMLAATRSSAQAVVNSTSWKATRSLRVLNEVLACVRETGLVGTIFSMLTLRFTKRLQWGRERAVIAHSGLFDATWYLTQYPDVADQNIEPILHYVLFGAAEGRDPSPLFDTSWYLKRHPDVTRAGMNPFVHYVLRGAIEGRRPHPRFEASAEPNPPTIAVESKSPTLRLDSRRLPARSNPAASLPVDDNGPWLMCVSHVRPDPPRAGNEYRLQRMLRWAAKGGYRVLLVHAPLPDDEPSEDALRRLATVYPNLVVCTRDGTIRYGLREAGVAEAGLAGLTGRPVTAFLGDRVSDGNRRAADLYTLERTFAHATLIETVLALDAVLKPKVVLVTYVFMTRFLPRLASGALKIVDTIDVFSARQTKVERYGVPDGLALTKAEEARYLARADVVVAIHCEEARDLAALAPDKQIVTVGVDFDLVPLPPAPEGKIALLVASDNAMNVKGVGDFLRFAWPLIRRQVPDAELWIAGKVCQALTFDGAGVSALGQIDDIDQLYRAASVTINPCVAGTGLKIKTVESLSRLRPVVCWPAGMEGLAPDLQQHCRVVENWYEFATEVTRSLQGDELQRALWSARDRVTKVLAADTVYLDLEDALRNHPARP